MNAKSRANNKALSPCGRQGLHASPSLANHLGVEEKLVLRWANHSDLIRIHGIGPQYAKFFEAAGVDTVRELAHRVPENLLAKLEEVNAANPMTRRVPALKEIKRYVHEAQQLEPMLEY